MSQQVVGIRVPTGTAVPTAFTGHRSTTGVHREGTGRCGQQGVSGAVEQSRLPAVEDQDKVPGFGGCLSRGRAAQRGSCNAPLLLRGVIAGSHGASSIGKDTSMSLRVGVVVAVDIGAARMKVAYADADGVVQLVRFERELWLPSGVQVEPDGSLLTGAAAMRRARQRPEGYIADPMGRLTADTVEAGGVVVQTADLVAALLRVALAGAVHAAGSPVGVVRVVTAGAWGPRRRGALRTALQRAGAADAELVAAPVAVGWHLLAGGADLPEQAIVTVCDLGAGFTASVLARTGDGFEALAGVEASDGGGDAMDAAVAAWLSPPTSPDGVVSAAAAAEAVVSARLAKEALSAAPTVLVPGASGQVVFGVPQLRQAGAAVLDRAVAAVVQAIEAADVGREHLGLLVCVGGGARSPVVADAFADAVGVRPVTVPQPDAAAVLGAVQQPVPIEDGVPVPSGRDAAGAVLAAAGSVALFGQFMSGTQRYGPLRSIQEGWLLANWSGLCLAAVLAVVATAAGASWLHMARYAMLPETPPDERLGRRLYGVALAASAVVGLGVCVGYAVIAVGSFEVPAGPLLRWSVLAATPVAAAVVVAGLLVIARPLLVQRSWQAWFRFPVTVVVLAGVGGYLIGYDVTDSPHVLRLFDWWLQQYITEPRQPIGPVGRLGAACLGVAVALLIARRGWIRVLTAVPLALLTATVLAWRSTGLITAVFGAVVAGWWLWRILAAVGGAALQVPAPSAADRPPAAAAGAAAGFGAAWAPPPPAKPQSGAGTAERGW
ncbi:Hsp70 family protein [Dactylosporangium aurantiacum]|uniref:Hsp70 family protein n=1 Tax=Dactylosporangium aurantiacum TaxID=35754 RepID=UPI0036834A73